MRVRSMPDSCPGQISWHYDRTEIVADGVVHAIGACLGIVGAVTILARAVRAERISHFYKVINELSSRVSTLEKKFKAFNQENSIK